MVIAAAGLIIKNKKILLTKRSNYTEAFPGCWTCPGGRADEGETAKDAVVREVKEEVGLDFTPTELFATGKWEDRELNRFLGEWSGEVKLQEEEITEFGWFTYDEAIKLDLAFDYRDVIKKLHQSKIL